MAVTDEQVATLRAHLAGDFDEYQRLWARLDPETTRTGYMTLVTTAFFEAVKRRFTEADPTSDIIEFVAQTRAQFEQDDQPIDPHVAERLIGSVIGDESIDDLNAETVASVQMVLLTALILDEQLDDAELDAFLAKARTTGDRLMG